MMGRNHIIVGACALEHAYLATVMIDKIGYTPLKIVEKGIMSYMGLTETSFNGTVTSTGLLLAFLAAYFIGSLLPDIDNPKSILGKIIHIPVKHRGWLHAIYLYLVIGGAGIVHPIFSWIFVGAIVHLFWDSLSACGNCWFYKLFSDYKTYSSGAKIKKGHKLKLYYAGEWSEYLFVFIIVAVSVAAYIVVMR